MGKRRRKYLARAWAPPRAPWAEEGGGGGGGSEGGDGTSVLRAVKRALDPYGVFGCGNLLEPAAPAHRSSL